MDDRKGVSAALGKNLRVTGTLGIIDLAAQRGLIDLSDAFARLRCTNFHCPEQVMEVVLAKHKST